MIPYRKELAISENWWKANLTTGKTKFLLTDPPADSGRAHYWHTLPETIFRKPLLSADI